MSISNSSSMLSRTQCLPGVARIPLNRGIWRQLPLRRYISGSTDEPQWFQQLRTEMLQRDVTYLLENITAQPEHRLANTLSGYLPPELCRPPTFRKPVLPIGHHLIWFNPALPTDQLLPDGTDEAHSPGGPWVRRMWAGGSLRLKPDVYFHKYNGFTLDTGIAGAERIRDVRLRGEGDTAKLFVTIERRFARLDTLFESHRVAHNGSEKTNGVNVQSHFKRQLRDDEEWGDALFKEERNLVFFKERTTAELDAIKAGQMATVKYLDPPGTPEFSHTLTPTRALLFRFSALTFNAHLIHLDQEYARNVEGHRNLLVHGPLSLTLMMQAMSAHVNAQTKGAEVIEHIEYRNLAPLYCDEEMRICGKEKKSSSHGRVYDIWIEGPTGGAAVKGTVYTSKRSKRDPEEPADSGKNELASTKASSMRRQMKLVEMAGDVSVRTNNRTVPSPAPKQQSSTSAREAAGISQSTSNESVPRPGQASQPSQSGATISSPTFTSLIEPQSSEDSSADLPSQTSTSPSGGRANRRNSPTRMRSHQFIVLGNSTPSVQRVNSVRPVKPRMSLRTRNIMRRLMDRPTSRSSRLSVNVKPVPILRKYKAAAYKRDMDRIVSRYSRFHRSGVRKVEKSRISAVGENLEEARPTSWDRFD